MYGYTCGYVDEFRDTVESGILSEESHARRRRHEKSQRRREVVGVQTEARHGRVDELPGEGASELAPLEQP